MSRKDSNLPIVAGFVAAIGASVCCLGPFLLLLLGISGSWISNLTLLEPYQPLFMAAAVMLFAWAGWKVYRPIEACAADTACAVPQVRKRRQIIFWISLVVALLMMSSAYWIPLIA